MTITAQNSLGNPFGKLFLLALLLALIGGCLMIATKTPNPQDPFDKCQKKNGIWKVFYNDKTKVYARVCEDKGKYIIQEVNRNSEGFWEEINTYTTKKLGFEWGRGWVQLERWMAEEVFNFIKVLK